MRFLVTIGKESFTIEAEAKPVPQTILVDGQPVEVDISRRADGQMALLVNHRSYEFETRETGEQWLLSGPRGRFAARVETELESRLRQSSGSGLSRARGQIIRAQMPGKIVAVAVQPGAAVKPQDVLLVQEAMKMENEIRCEVEGHVKHVHVSAGQAVESGARLVEIE